MKQYEEQGTRRFDDVIYTAGLTFETAGAYLLGRDLASMMLAKTLTAIEEALMASTRGVQLSAGATDREELDSLLRAFASGVRLGSI